MQKTLLGLALFGLIAGCATDDESGTGSPQGTSQEVVGGASGTLAAQDATFVREAGQFSLAEVKTGQLATRNSQNEAVRKFGQKMVDDHLKLNTELKQIASRKGASLMENDLGKHQTHYDRLAPLKGQEFDRAFREHAIKDHDEAIRLFEKESQQGDADLKAFAQKHLAHLREHLNMAKQLDAGQATQGQPNQPTRQNTQNPQ